MATTKVREIMTTNVATVRSDDSFSEVVRLLTERRVSALPVVDAAGRVVGVVSEADLLRKEEYKGRPDEPARLFGRRTARRARARASATTVAGLMSSPAITIMPGIRVSQAARTMAEHGVKRLPVVDENERLIGIVSRGDLLKAFLKTDKDLTTMVKNDVILHGMWIDPIEITVEVKDGVVTLSGEMERRSLISVLVGITAAQDGVVDVVDHLTCAWDDTARGAVDYRR